MQGPHQMQKAIKSHNLETKGRLGWRILSPLAHPLVTAFTFEYPGRDQTVDSPSSPLLFLFLFLSGLRI